MSDVGRDTFSVTVNGRTVEARPGELLIEVAERAGSFIPRFCYHPRMEPVGVCRMCLVEVDGPRGPALQPACYLRVSDGMNVTTDSPKVKKAQDGVLEFLLANHPLDCPVCDKGGECPLQDQALTHGAGETRFIEEKRHFVKPIEIGPLVLLDRERCIQCSRCTRFQSEVAGDAQIDFAGRGDLIEVAPSPEQPFDSVFSGNTVQICPVGALTAKPYRFTARPWDLEQAESTCTACAVGCRVAVQSSGNRLTRVLGVDSDAVNRGWMCDKGRYVFDAVDGNEDSVDLADPRTRLRQPLVRRGDDLVAVTWGEAIERAASILRDSTGDAAGVIGGAALTNEGAFAWSTFAREVLGTDHVDAQYGDGLDGALLQALAPATIDDATNARVIVTMAGDLRDDAPILFVRLREAVVKGGRPLVCFDAAASSLASLASVALSVRPGESDLVVRALVDPTASLERDSLVTGEQLEKVRALIGDGQGVVVVAGRANLAEDPAVVESALRRFAERFPAAKFLPVLRRANTRGALDMGLAPSLRAGRTFAADRGRDTLAQLSAMRAGTQRAAIILGDLLGNVVDVDGATQALAAAQTIVVAGHGGPALAHADVVLPALVQHEREGTVTNLEGRVSAVAAKVVGPRSAWSDVAIVSELAVAFDRQLGLESVVATAEAIEAATGYPCATVLADPSLDGALSFRASVASRRRPLDPMAFPGVRPVGVVGLGESAGDTVAPLVVTGAARGRAATLDEVEAGRGIDVARPESYAWALVLARRLYDTGAGIVATDALRALVDGPAIGLCDVDLDRLGVSDGDEVVVRGADGELRLTARSARVPRGVVQVFFGASQDATAFDWSALLDDRAPVSYVTVATR